MTLTVATVANMARDYHSALSPQAAPQAVAYRALSRFQDQIVEEITSRVPGFLGQTVSVTFDAATFTDGIDLADIVPAGVKDFIDARFLYDQSDPQSYVSGLFVPYEQRDMPHPIPAYTLLNNVILLLGNDQVGQLSQAYENYEGLVLSYTPIPADLTADASVFILPDDAKEALASMLAAFWVRRLVGNPNFQVERADADYWDVVANEERKRFLTRIFRTTQRQSYYIREVR